MTATTEMILVLGMIILGMLFLPIAAQFIGSESESIIAGTQENLAEEVSDHITAITGQRNEHIAVTYDPPVDQYVLTITENRIIQADVPGTGTQSAATGEVYLENNQIQDADSICIIKNGNAVGLREGPCCESGSSGFPEKRP